MVPRNNYVHSTDQWAIKMGSRCSYRSSGYFLPSWYFFAFSGRFTPTTVTGDHTWYLVVNRTYGTQKKLYICLFLLTVFGPIYSGPP